MRLVRESPKWVVSVVLVGAVLVPVTPVDDRWIGPLDVTSGVRSAGSTSYGGLGSAVDAGVGPTVRRVAIARFDAARTDVDRHREHEPASVAVVDEPGDAVTPPVRRSRNPVVVAPPTSEERLPAVVVVEPPAPAPAPPPTTPAPPPTTPAPTTTVADQGVWRAWRVNPDGSPVRYDGCAPIPYVTRLHTGPSFARAELDWAIRQIEMASGLDLQWAGDVTAPNSAGWPVHIGFASEDEVFMPSWASGYGESDVEDVGGGFFRYVGGRVILRPDHDWTPGLESRNPLGTMFLHELGHLVGLGHVDAPNEIMTTLGNGTVRALGPGDRRGLAAIGPGDRC